MWVNNNETYATEPLKMSISKAFKRNRWMKNKRIKAILPISINVSSTALIRPNYSYQCSEQA